MQQDPETEKSSIRGNSRLNQMPPAEELSLKKKRKLRPVESIEQSEPRQDNSSGDRQFRGEQPLPSSSKMFYGGKSSPGDQSRVEELKMPAIYEQSP